MSAHTMADDGKYPGDFRDCETVVVGLGASGLSVARYLAKDGRTVVVLDTRDHAPRENELRRELDNVVVIHGPLNFDRFNALQQVIVSPGISANHQALVKLAHSGVSIIGDIELFARHCREPVIAITGSNGKSTVTALVGEICRKAGYRVDVGGNYGTPALDMLASETDLYVLELSSFQLETTRSLRTLAGTILNISMDHMDRYVSMDEYVAAKFRILEFGGLAVLNREDPCYRKAVAKVKLSRSFGLGPPQDDTQYGLRDVNDSQWIYRGERKLMDCARIALPGRHNYLNAMAAMALVEPLSIEQELIESAIAEYKGLPHRCEWVREHRGIVWINDSKGTNVGATAAAIAGFDQPIVLIAGGEGKEADFSPLGKIAIPHVKQIVLFGRDAAIIADAIGDRINCRIVADLHAAVIAAAGAAQPGDLVLFSPACASFDMFENYIERGEAFKSIVKALH